MKLLTIIIRPEKLNSVTAALHTIGINGMTISDVRGQGIQKGIRTIYRGVEYQTDFIMKSKIETVVSDEMCEKVLETVMDAACTGQVGDGKIFVSDVHDAVRIRTGERGNNALGL
ncbi:P-II family nitrogen regulator [Paenibacillus sp. P26]|nr:P-II family nitrogen regulator [Paenibacillus sp. P26]UUZ95076.1 P-II family nitrogen regulator [Paenibacillus sp. P25]